MGIKVNPVFWRMFCFMVFMHNFVVFALGSDSLVLPQQEIQSAPAKIEAFAAQNEKVVPAQDNGRSALGNEERITLDLKGVDILELFKMLSQKSGLTIVSTAQVKGRATVFLNNLTAEDCLDVIITTQDLAYERKENLIKVMTADEYEQAFGKKFSERKKIKTIKLVYAKPADLVNIISALKSDMGKIIIDESSGTILLIETPQAIALIEEAVKELDQPLASAVFDINYARSEDVKAYVNAYITPGLGQVIIDERDNKIIVSDLPRRLERIRGLIKEIDESSRQVMLTAKIVQVDLDSKFYRGIEWEKLFSNPELHNLDFAGKFPVSPVSANYQKISVGTLSRDDYSLVLKLLQEYGSVKTVSQPRILAVNNEEAKILIGVKDAFITQVLSQGQSTTVTSETVQFIDVGVKLKVVPTINKQGFITMKIKPEVSSIKETITTSSGSRIPIVQTSEAETVVKVKDGAMIIIAGFMKDSDTQNISSAPGLSKIPLIGALFKAKTRETPKSELIVFLTPKLVSGDAAPEHGAKNE